MGYQVGNHCYATKAEAENVYFSLVVPVIQTNSTSVRPSPLPNVGLQQQNAKIIAPEFKNGKWYLQNTVIQANLPFCNPAKNMRDGAELGWIVSGVFAGMYVFILIKRLLK